MTMLMQSLSHLRAQTRGSMAIETAIVAPVLLMLSLGGFDASRLVARQSELQSAASEAEAIVQAAVPTDAAARETIREALQASLDPDGSNPNDSVSLTEIYRCGSAADYVTENNCGEGVAVATFVRITLTDTVTPHWTNFGIGEPLDYTVVRMVQIS